VQPRALAYTSTDAFAALPFEKSAAHEPHVSADGSKYAPAEHVVTESDAIACAPRHALARRTARSSAIAFRPTAKFS